MKPDENNYDMMFTTPNFIIHGTDKIPFLYFTFAAKGFSKISVYLEFSFVMKEEQKLGKTTKFTNLKMKKHYGTEFALMFEIMTENEKEIFRRDLSNFRCYYILLFLLF